jgi:tetratricopeptide (TPR) repeat protein
MNPAPNLVSGMIIKACELILAGQYEASLALIKVSRAYDSQNEFLHFLDHRIEKFYKESARADMSQEERRGFIRSLQGIVIEALEKAEGAPKPDLDERKIDYLQAMKNSFLARAEYYMGREEYQNALIEVERVFLIDPDNEDAAGRQEQLRMLISERKSRVADEQEADQQISANSDKIFVIKATPKVEEEVPTKE